MKKAAVTSMRSGRGSVGYFHWEDAMTVKVDFSIFFRYMSVKKEPKSKVKIKNWLGVEEIGRYENFVAQWHYFQKDAQKVLGEISQEALVKKLHLYLLTLFYQKPMMETGFLQSV